MIKVHVCETSSPSPQGRTALCSVARTASRSSFLPGGAFSQVIRDPSGSQPPPGSDARGPLEELLADYRRYMRVEARAVRAHGARCVRAGRAAVPGRAGGPGRAGPGAVVRGGRELVL